MYEGAITYLKIAAFLLQDSAFAGLFRALVEAISCIILKIDSLVLDSPLAMPMILLRFNLQGLEVFNIYWSFMLFRKVILKL
jgi:hypothetical protein